MKPAVSCSPLGVRSLLAIFALSVALIGCGEETSRPETSDLPRIEGALVPEAVEEGQSAEVEVWGTAPRAGWSFERFIVEKEQGSVITLRPIGTIEETQGQMSAQTFHGTAELVDLAVGDHTIRICGADRIRDFPMHVFPRDPMLRLLVRGGPDAAHEELVIGADWAMAFRRGESHPVRIPFSGEEVDRVRHWFQSSGFFDMAPRYLGDSIEETLFIDVVYREGDRRKRILAEEDFAPEALLELVGELRNLIATILEGTDDRPPLIGRITIEPLDGDASVERTIRLSIVNQSDEPRSLVFPTSQTYDVAIFDMRHAQPGHGGEGCPGEHPSGDEQPVDDGWHHPIWTWSHDKDFLQVELELTFAAREEKVFEVTWDCTTNEAEVVENGMYGVIGIVAGHPEVPIRRARVRVGAIEPPPSLRLDLTVEPPTGAEGSERTLTFTIANPTDEPITLQYPDNQHYDFHISDPRSMRPNPIWSWSFGRGFTDQPTARTIPAHDRVRFVERWNGHANDGSIVRAGDYAAVAVLTSRHPLSTAVRRIRIEP